MRFVHGSMWLCVYLYERVCLCVCLCGCAYGWCCCGTLFYLKRDQHRRARKRPKIETEEGTKLFFFSYHNRFAIVVVNGGVGSVGTAFARLKCHAVFIFSQLLPRMVFHSKVNETHDFPGPYGTVVDTVREN